MTLKTRPLRVCLQSRSGAALPGAVVKAELTEYQVDGIDVVKLTWALTEDSDAPGYYSGTIWPNTRGDGSAQYTVTADAGDRRMQSQLHTFTDGPADQIISISMMVNPQPWPSVYPAADVVDAARVFSESAGASASLAQGAQAASQALAAQLGDIQQAVNQTTQARDAAVPAAQQAEASNVAAQQALVQTEAARDSVNSTGRVYDSAAAGVAAGTGVASGQTFSVLDSTLMFWITFKNNAGAAVEVARSYTKAYIDGLITQKNFRGWVEVHTDLSGKLSYGITTAGRLILGVGGDIVARITAVEGSTNVQRTHFVPTSRGGIYAWMLLDAARTKVALAVTKTGRLLAMGRDVLAEIDANKSNITALSTNTATRRDGNTRSHPIAVIDDNGKTPWFVDRKGRVKLWGRDVLAEIDAMSASIEFGATPSTVREGVAYLVYQYTDGSGNRQIKTLRKSDGKVTLITTSGNNVNPVLTSDNKVLFVSDATGAYVQCYAPADGGATYPTFATTDIACWGDSLTAGAGSTGGQTYPVQLAAMLGDGRNIYNGGIGGQNSAQIAARQGGAPSLLTVTGNQIPASGGVAVTAKTVNFLYSSGTYSGSSTGTLAGVPGTLTTDSSGNWTFTRTTNGLATNCPAGSPFIPDAAVAYRGRTVILTYGRNDGGSDPTQLLALLASSIAYLTPYYKQFLIGLILNSTTEYVGTSGYNAIKAKNDAIKAAYPNNYLDTQAPPTVAEMAALGFVPTAQDNTDIANDCIPTEMRANPPTDTLHLNNYGYGLWALRAKTIIQAKGW